MLAGSHGREQRTPPVHDGTWFGTDGPWLRAGNGGVSGSFQGARRGRAVCGSSL